MSATDNSDAIFAQAIRNRLEEMKRRSARSSSSELVIYCQLIARAKGAVPAWMKETLGFAILDVLEEFETVDVFGRTDISPGLQELGMTFSHLEKIRAERAAQAALRKRKEPSGT